MRKINSIVVLTGAGISAESGIQTFRAQDGLWEEHRIEDVATPQAFMRNPALVQRFYNQRRQPLLDNKIQANPAHISLAQLENDFTGELTLITQNIDNLHEKAGSQNTLHMHGQLLKMRCTSSQQLFDCLQPISIDDRCQCCNQAGTLRPHIVWFGEMPLFMDKIMAALSRCDLFLSIGTSGNVYPAAGFADIAKQAQAHCIEFNLERSLLANNFDTGIYGKASAVLPDWVAQFCEDNYEINNSWVSKQS